MKLNTLSIAIGTVLASQALWAEDTKLPEITVEATQLSDVSGEEIKSADLAEALTRKVPSISLVRRSGIANLPGTICSTTDHYRRCIRLSFGFPWSDALEKAVRLLGEFVAANRAA